MLLSLASVVELLLIEFENIFQLETWKKKKKLKA